jgi:hypothetical protein
MRRYVSLLLFCLLAAACESPKYATFDPLREDVAVERVQRQHFSMPVPKEWRVDTDTRTLSARETPPDNGGIRAYRRVVVEPIAAILGDDEGTRNTNAMAYLRARFAPEGLDESEAGRAQFAERDSIWVRGTVARGSIDLRFDVWACVVPCRDAAFFFEFSTPAGQFEASWPGFSALKRGFETDLLPPRGSGPVEWLGDGRIGLCLDDWTVQRDVDGCAAVLTRAGSSVRGELRLSLRALPFDLDAFVDDYATEHASTRRDLVVQSVERGRRDLRTFARVRSVWRDGARTVAGVEVVATTEGRLERLLVTVPVGEWREVAAEVEAMAESMRGR